MDRSPPSVGEILAVALVVFLLGMSTGIGLTGDNLGASKAAARLASFDKDYGSLMQFLAATALLLVTFG